MYEVIHYQIIWLSLPNMIKYTWTEDTEQSAQSTNFDLKVHRDVPDKALWSTALSQIKLCRRYEYSGFSYQSRNATPQYLCDNPCSFLLSAI